MLGMAQLACEHDHHVGTLLTFSTLPFALALWMSLSILLFLYLQGSDIRASALHEGACLCVSQCVSMCLCSRVRETASELDPVVQVL